MRSPSPTTLTPEELEAKRAKMRAAVQKSRDKKRHLRHNKMIAQNKQTQEMLRVQFSRLIKPGAEESEHEPTEDLRLLVQQCAGLGLTDDEVAKMLLVSVPTLQQHYGYELETGGIRMKFEVASTLYSIATDKKHKQCFSAAKHYLSMRAGWTETSRLEVTGKDGAPLNQLPVLDSRRLSSEEREVLRTLLLKSTPPQAIGMDES